VTRLAWLALLLTASISAPAIASQRQQQPPAGTDDGVQPPAISAGEVQRLYDAYALVRAQEALQLSDDQYGRFVTRLKNLQETRRRHQQARNQILQDLRRLTSPQTGAADEAAIREKLTALRGEDERGAAELHKALDGVDEVLDVRQQARFRLFEERLEQRKLELLLRARQNARRRNPS
jgi:hypothetical protein